ncbi:hypothetical protein A8U91_03942 [Halomonas elongata]|uniref:Uncharacterized protein n=1 Tax=Halomonas elongata TaxID=2746 RepID=A0A1B8NY03_HALEL|nr:hypothetical protein A8U91_03942 [Halomonas elongata]
MPDFDETVHGQQKRLKNQLAFWEDGIGWFRNSARTSFDRRTGVYYEHTLYQ